MFFFVLLITILYFPNIGYTQFEERNTLDSNDLTKIVNGNTENIVILSLKVDKYILQSAFVIYYNVDTGRMLIPLNRLMTELEFQISFDPKTLIAEGWYINENNKFILDLQKRIAHTDKQYTLSRKNTELHEGDLYLEKTLIEKLFDLSITIDYSNLSLYVSHPEPLPFQMRLKKEGDRKKIKKK